MKLWLVDGYAALPCRLRLIGTKVSSDLSCIKGSQLSSKSSSVCLQSQQDVQIRCCGEPLETISNRWFFLAENKELADKSLKKLKLENEAEKRELNE